MLGRLPKLLGPTPTVVYNPYAWKLDNRTTSEKIRSGFRLAGGLVAGFLILVLGIGATKIWPNDPTGRYGPVISWIAMTLTALVLLLTVPRWVQAASGFVCVGAIRLAFGTVASIGNSNLFTQLGEGLLLTCTVIALLWRFLGRRPAPTTLLDRVALTFAMLSAMKEVARPQHNPPIALILGIAALGVAWAAYRWNEIVAKATHESDKREQSGA